MERAHDGSGWQEMAESSSKLTRKQEEAIVALLSQRSTEEAARVTGVGARTLYRWLGEPAFDAAYRKARRAAFGQAAARLQHASSAAATTLLKLMMDPGTPASCRLRAADSILSHGAKAIEIEDLDARLAEVERIAQASKSRN